MKSPPPDKEKKPGMLLNAHRKTVESTKGMSSAVLLGSSFAMAMGIFAWIGHRWDEKNGTEPWGVLAGVFAGFLYGGYEVWKVTRSGPHAGLSKPPPSAEVKPKDPQGPGEH